MCSPFAAESLSDPDGVVVLTTPDGRDGASPDPASPDPASPGRTALDRLSSLPCVVVAVDRATGDTPALADVVAEKGVASAEQIARAVERNPVAATTLVLCLREASTSLGRALVAESAAYSVLQAGAEVEVVAERARGPRRRDAVKSLRDSSASLRRLRRDCVSSAWLIAYKSFWCAMRPEGRYRSPKGLVGQRPSTSGAVKVR